jgi:hypothetical protein
VPVAERLFFQGFGMRGYFQGEQEQDREDTGHNIDQEDVFDCQRLHQGATDQRGDQGNG